MKLFWYSVLLFVFTLISCNTSKSSDAISTIKEATIPLPYFTFQKENVFPGDGSLVATGLISLNTLTKISSLFK